ncbi:MAG: alkyl hydroperoxide reductase [Chloroflexi bacterium]|nr:alkyl hydroperoxide reductase [Chloroflexota bacterium]
MHVLPQLRKLETKYADVLTVIGVHSAKFKSEKSTENVREAVRRYGIGHPVVNDANFEIWKSYGVRAWPTLMFIGPSGRVIGRHEGEFEVEALTGALDEMIEEYEDSGLFRRGAFEISPESAGDTPLSFPGKITADAGRLRLIISDSNHSRLVISNLEGNVETVIGSGESPLVEDESRGVFSDRNLDEPLFDNPQGTVAIDDLVYVADAGTHTIVRINLDTGLASTVAGTGEQSLYRHNGGDALKVPLNSPYDLSLHAGVLYIAMAGFHQLWSMDVAAGTIAPFAGDGGEDIMDGLKPEARLAQPYGVEVSNNAVFFIDSETSSVRVAAIAGEGRVVTLVGTGLFDFGDHNGVGKEALLQHPQGLTVHNDTIYIADSYNNKVKSMAIGSLQVRTVAGSGKQGAANGALDRAEFSEPAGLAIVGDRIFVADTNNHLIRVIDIVSNEVSTLELKGL